MNKENHKRLIRTKDLIEAKNLTFSEKESVRKLALSNIQYLIDYYDQVKCVEVPVSNPVELDPLLHEMLIRDGWTPPWEPAKFDQHDFVIPRSNELGLPYKPFRVLHPARRKNGEVALYNTEDPFSQIVTTEDRLIRLVPEE